MIGTTVSHYRILEHLGGGGMGVVYKAEDLKLERTVALKFLPPEWSRDPDARERFMREAKAASALDHPNICNIHEIDETDEGRLFIAMAFYEGETLKKRIERGPLPIRDAVDLAVHTAEGLTKAHEQGITHRDIKPANILLTSEGDVKIVDFGLAKLAGEHGLTRTGSTVGTPHYMSPEQARCDEVGPATDIWSLGVVLYEMVSGVRPFRGENGDAVVHSILHEQPPRLRDLRSDTPAMLERIVKRSLEKQPEKRYASVGELLTDLTALEAAESEAGLQTTTMGAVPGKRRRLIAALGLAFLVVFAVVMIWVLREQSKPRPVPKRPPRIVVLPFKNPGPPEDAYLAFGITEEITSRLSAVSGLRVISRTTADHYQGTDKTIQEIGEELNVGYVLEGSVLWDRAGEGRGRVRITPQLIRVADDTHLWSERYDRVIEDIFEVQSDIAQRVITELEITLLEPEQRTLEARPTENMEAYNAYLRGLGYHGGYLSEELERAVAMFERAVELDPEFALALALLSVNHSFTYRFGHDMTEERLARARRAADRALALDHQLPEAHWAMGVYHACKREYNEALQAYTIADRLRPNDADVASSIGGVHEAQGRWREAVAGFERAVELDPHNYQSLCELAENFTRLRRYPEAADVIDQAIAFAPDRPTGYVSKWWIYYFWHGPSQQSRRVLEQTPAGVAELEFNWIYQELMERSYEAALHRLSSFPQPVTTGHWLLFPVSLGECWCYAWMNEPDRTRQSCEAARVVLEQALGERPDDPAVHISLGLAYAFLGEKDRAIDHAERAMALLPISEDAALGPDLLEAAGWVFAEVGELDRAFDHIEYLLSNPTTFSIAILQLEPWWDPLRDHPRFQEILEKYGEEQ
jgi:TolB-like protein/Tfp pilus assembly protein PilF/predicted Ser/Thr protein kinase